MMNTTTQYAGSGNGDDLFIDYDDILNQINTQEALHMLPVIFFYAIVLIVGLFGNLLVLVVYTFRYKRSQARIFILFLASNDFLMCLFGLPYQLVDMTHPYTYTNSLLCKVSSFIMVSLFHISVFGLVVIAVDRYTKICHPLGKFHTQYFGKRRACVIAVILGLLLSWPILFLYGPSEMETGVYNITGHACFYEYSDPESNIVLIYSTTTLCFCVGCTVCLIVLYSLVFYQIYTRYQRGASLRSLQQHAEDSTYYINEDKDCENQGKNDPESRLKNNNGINGRYAIGNRICRGNGLDDQGLILSVRIPFVTKLNDHDERKYDRERCDIDSDSDVGDDECIRNLIEESDNRVTNVNMADIGCIEEVSENDDKYVVIKPIPKPCCVESDNSKAIYEIDNDTKVTQPFQEIGENNSTLVDNMDNTNGIKHNGQVGRRNSTTASSTIFNTLGKTGLGFETNKINHITKDLELNPFSKIHKPTDSEINADPELEDAKLTESLRKLYNDAPLDIPVSRPRSKSCYDSINRCQGARLSLPLDSIQSVCSSRSSIISANSTTNMRTVTFGGANGLRIHSRVNNASQVCINGSAQNSKAGHSKITKIMITITTLFILSYTPTLIIIIWSNVRPEIWDIISIHETLVFEFCLRFYLINNICNPFIYGFWDKRFKREVVFTFRKLSKKFMCCRK